MPRQKIDPRKKYKQHSISLPPEAFDFISKKCFRVRMGISEYFQTLVCADRRENLIQKELTLKAKSAA